MKKLLWVLFFVGMCFFVFGQESQPSSDFDFFVKGEGTDREVIITGYNGSESIIRIPSAINNIPVTGITGDPNGGGIHNQVVVEVVLPDTLEYIGLIAFSGCRNLKKINIPNQLKTVDWGAFNATGLDEDIRMELIAKFGVDVFYWPW
jgi:hypothetical protein